MNSKTKTMKCFHFSGDDDEAGSRSNRISLARSSSVSDSRKSGSDPPDPDPPPESDGQYPSSSPPRSTLRAFQFAELKAATRGFSRSLVIGEGGFGCVYRGIINDADVAVKQLNRSGSQGHKEWITEVDFLAVVKHPNLVKLVGYCAEDDERGMQRLLVYELMRNKSLEDHLLGRVPSSSSNLSWTLRLKIAQDAARGLAYLHEEMEFQLIFRDFKTSNILLDEDFNAKLSDFGLARHGPAEGAGHVSTSEVVGTVGYAAPEYIQTGRLTAKSDVWSFGVVLYELISGRRPLDRNLPRNEQKLLEWVKPYTGDPKKFHIILDPRFKGEYSVKSARKLISLANKCLVKKPKSRPRMSEVVELLSEIIEISRSAETAVPPPPPLVEEEEEEEEEDVESTSTDHHAKELVLHKESSSSSSSHRSSSHRSSSSSSSSSVFDIKELMSLRNRSSAGGIRFDWRILTPGRPVGKLAWTWG